MNAIVETTGPTLVDVYLASLAPGSRPTTISSLEIVARDYLGGCSAREVPWHELRHAHMAALRRQLRERYAPSTVNRILSAIRQLLAHAFHAGLMEERDYRHATAVKNLPNVVAPAGRALSPSELREIIASCPTNTLLGMRDAAMVACLYGCGLRIGEVCGLDVDDYTGRELRVRHGKGDKARVTYPPAGTQRALDRWLTRRGRAPGPLFCPTRAKGQLEIARLSKGAADQFVQRLGRRTKLDAFASHDFRRTFVGDLLDQGADLATVQELAGHASPVTTARYDRRPARTRAAANALLVVPFE